jgi:hypothetical protein
LRGRHPTHEGAPHYVGHLRLARVLEFFDATSGFLAAGALLGETSADFQWAVAVEDQPGQDLDDRLICLYPAGVSNLFEVRVESFLFSFGTKLAAAIDVPIERSGTEGYGTMQNGVEVRHPHASLLRDDSSETRPRSTVLRERQGARQEP